MRNVEDYEFIHRSSNACHERIHDFNFFNDTE